MNKWDKRLKGKEYTKAMQEMECWSVQNHLKKCKKCNQLTKGGERV